MHTNKTIFDNEISIYQPQNINEVIEDIEEIKQINQKSMGLNIKILLKDLFIIILKNPMENYVELIKNIKNLKNELNNY